MYLITIDFSKLGKKLNDDIIPLRNMLLTRKIKLNYTYPKENSLQETTEKKESLEPHKQ